MNSLAASTGDVARCLQRYVTRTGINALNHHITRQGAAVNGTAVNFNVNIAVIVGLSRQGYGVSAHIIGPYRTNGGNGNVFNILISRQRYTAGRNACTELTQRATGRNSYRRLSRFIDNTTLQVHIAVTFNVNRRRIGTDKLNGNRHIGLNTVLVNLVRIYMLCGDSRGNRTKF